VTAAAEFIIDLAEKNQEPKAFERALEDNGAEMEPVSAALLICQEPFG